MRYERILKEAIIKYRPIIEDISGKKLTEPQIKPDPSKSNARENLRIGLSFLGMDLGGVKLAQLNLDTSGNSDPVICYNPCVIMNLIPRKAIEYTAAHELAHLAHLEGRRLEEFSNANSFTLEKVADYMAVFALGTPKIPLHRNRTYEAQGFIQGTLKRLGKSFKEALPELGFIESN